MHIDSRLERLESILSTSGYFDNAKYSTDNDNLKLTIDNKYDIYVKSGNYMMNIKDIKLEDKYCEIVDAVTMNFGGKKGESLKTCKYTLDGIIDLGGISVEFFDTYKILTINSSEKATLYNPDNNYSDKDIISIDEKNYAINFSDFLLTTMSTKYVESMKTFSICGNIYNKKVKTANILFKIYDDKKKEISTKTYKYESDTGHLEPFCVNFENDSNIAKYYSVALDK